MFVCWKCWGEFRRKLNMTSSYKDTKNYLPSSMIMDYSHLTTFYENDMLPFFPRCRYFLWLGFKKQVYRARSARFIVCPARMTSSSWILLNSYLRIAWQAVFFKQKFRTYHRCLSQDDVYNCILQFFHQYHSFCAVLSPNGLRPFYPLLLHIPAHPFSSLSSSIVTLVVVFRPKFTVGTLQSPSSQEDRAPSTVSYASIQKPFVGPAQ